MLLISGNLWAQVMPTPDNLAEPQMLVEPQTIGTPVASTQAMPTMPAHAAKLNAPRKVATAANEAKIGTTEYATLQDAINAANAGETVTLLTNIYPKYQIVINKAITLDLNYKNIASYYQQYIMYITGNVTIKNGGVYSYDWSYFDPSDNTQTEKSVYALYANGSYSVNLENLIISGMKDYPNYGIVASGATLNMNDVTVDGYYAMYCLNNATANIYGDSKITAPYYGVYSNNSNINISGNTIFDCGYDGATYGSCLYGADCALTISDNASLSGNGSKAAIMIWNSATTKTNVTVNGNPTIIGYGFNALNVYSRVTLNGGSFISKATNPTRAAVYNNSGNVVINGGYYQSEGEQLPVVNQATMTVKGGTFQNKIEAFGNNVGPAKGYAYQDNNDGTYTLRLVIAKISGSDVNYFSLQDAIDAAEEGATITLYADTEENVTVSNKSITFDSDGNTLTGNITAGEGGEVLLDGTGTIAGSLIEDGGSILVYTGKFTNDPSAFVQTAEGCTVSGPANNVYKVIQEVAQVNGNGGTKYSSFAAAIAAANNMENATVTLLYNARLGSEDLNVSKNMTIDLNGNKLYTLSNANSYLRFGTTGTTVTIQNGTLENRSTAIVHPAAIVALVGGNVVLDNVAITNKGQAAVVVGNANSTLTVNAGCSLTGANCAALLTNGALANNANLNKVAIGQNGAVSITNNTGATISLTTNNVSTNALTINNAGTFEIVDGIYAGSINVATGSIAIGGGIFYDDVKAMVENYNVASKSWNPMTYNGDAAWDLHEASEVVVATIDGQNYYSLDDALLAIPANKIEKTIVLVSDINVDVNKDKQFALVKDQYVVLDLNGHKINATNTSKLNTSILFDIVLGAKLTIDDSSDSKNGIITYNSTCVGGSLVYTINCNGTLIVENGTIENTSSTSLIGGVPYTIELGKAGVLTMNGGLINNVHDYAIRYWADTDTRTELNLNGGEIKGARAVWIHLPGSDASQSPYAKFNMRGGKLTCNHEGGQALYVYTFGASLNNITINVSGGIIDGNFYAGGGTAHGGNYNEDLTITGGTFLTSKAFHSFRRGVEHRSILGGAFYFGPETTANDYIRFCEYILTGHYAVKMCRDDVNGTYSADNIDGKYNLCEGKDCGDGSFWAIIDGEGEKPKKETNADGTWAVVGSGDGVFNVLPDAQTDVVIKEGTVTVMSGVEAEVNRVVIEEGAGIIVKDGATLNVGTGGIEVDSTGVGTTFVKVEAGGTLIANGTVVSKHVEEIIVEANADGVGTVLLDPNVDYNNQPLATVEMYTYARYIPAQDKYIWQHFGIPTLGAPTSITNNRSCGTQYWQWNYEAGDWEQTKYSLGQVNTPFRGYNLKTNYTGTDGVIYTFTGQILGNGDATFNLQPGFNFYANSYLAPIEIEKMIEDVKDAGDDIEWTVWMYDGQLDNFVISNELTRMFGENLEIPAMRGFFLKLANGSGSTTGINYENAVWGNTIGAKAPARSAANNMNTVVISVAGADGKGDNLYLAESNRFDANFDNGYDASKQMSEESINLYAETMNGTASAVATDDLNGLYISMNTKAGKVYTMTFNHQNGEVYSLLDCQNNTMVQMVEGATYTFTAAENAEVSNRFKVVRAPKVTTDVESATVVDKSNGVYTVLGQYVGSVNEWAILPAGVYVVNGQKIVK